MLASGSGGKFYENSSKAIPLSLGLILLTFLTFPSRAMALKAGDLDPTFGGTGLVTTDLLSLGRPDHAQAVVLQKDGKIVVGGYSYSNKTGPASCALARYLPDGATDLTFGTLGAVITPVRTKEGSAHCTIAGMTLQPDGKILAVGRIEKDKEISLIVLRYNPIDGSLDSTFGTKGIILDGFKGRRPNVSAVAFVNDEDPKIFVAGSVYDSLTGFNFLLACYTLKGEPCSGFGDGGKVTTDFFARDDDARAIVIDPRGRILLGGMASELFLDVHFALARYNPNGSLDKTFGSAGTVFGPLGTGNSLAIQSDEKIILAGTVSAPLSLHQILTLDYHCRSCVRWSSVDNKHPDSAPSTKAHS